MHESPRTAFAMDRDAMTRQGYAVIDRIVEHLAVLPQKPAMRSEPRAELEKKLNEPIPADGSDLAGVLDQLEQRVLTAIAHLNHPRFFAFIPAPGNYISVLADAIAAAYSPFCGTWISGAGAAEIELVVIDWLRQQFGLPEGSGGLFLSGGSLANLTALAAARETKPDRDRHIFYCSDQTHASIDRALRILGYGASQLRRLPSGDARRLRIADLEAAVADDRTAGRVPVCVIANAGTTNTGAVDPLTATAYFCRREGLWLHCDGAYGASAILSERGRRELEGIAGVDSLTLDPHKWMFQPYDCGCLLVRDPDRLRRVFAYTAPPEYLQDTVLSGADVNFCDLGPELTRPFRALKLWLSLKVFGTQAFARAIEHGYAMAEYAETELRRRAGWEIVSPAAMAIVAFRHTGGGDEFNRRLADLAARDGCCFLSTTVLGGRTALRLCTIHPGTTEDDVRTALDCLERYAVSS